jgi:putative spermidine/putrescine transport system permease protein
MRRAALAATMALVLGYLVFPILIVVPLSFSSAKYLSFPPPGFSVQWYAAFFGSDAWLSSAWTSIWVAAEVTVLSVLLGTPAAIGLHRGRFPGRGAVRALILSPLIVPGIIVAIGVYFVYARFGLVGHAVALVFAHTCIGVPFVVINVGAALHGVDHRLEQAAQSLGAAPLASFRQVTLPLIGPGIFAGAVFAFITSFDELLIALFLSGSTAVTLPRRMFDQIRFDIDPTVAAVSAMLIFATSGLMLSAELARRRAEGRRTRPVPSLAT